MIKIIGDKTNVTVSENEYSEKFEIEIPDDASVGDMMDIWIHVLHNEGYALESVQRMIDELCGDGVKDYWF